MWVLERFCLGIHTGEESTNGKEFTNCEPNGEEVTNCNESTNFEESTNGEEATNCEEEKNVDDNGEEGDSEHEQLAEAPRKRLCEEGKSRVYTTFGDGFNPLLLPSPLRLSSLSPLLFPSSFSHTPLFFLSHSPSLLSLPFSPLSFL